MAGLKAPSSLKELIPPALKSKDIFAVDGKILVQKHSSNGKVKYTLELVWDEDEPPKFSDSSLLRPKPSSEILISCDGPCRDHHPAREVHTMGRCDHYLCNLCYRMNNNEDGSIGCTAFDCMRTNIYGHLSEKEAWEAYQKDVVTRYKSRKSRQEQSKFQCERQLHSLSNPHSRKSTKRETSQKLTTAALKFLGDSLPKISVRTMVYHKKHGRADSSQLAHSFHQHTDLKTVIKYAVRLILGSSIGQETTRASIGTSENQAGFKPLDKEDLNKTLIDVIGANGRLNLIVDTLEKLKL